MGAELAKLSNTITAMQLRVPLLQDAVMAAKGELNQLAHAGSPAAGTKPSTYTPNLRASFDVDGVRTHGVAAQGLLDAVDAVLKAHLDDARASGVSGAVARLETARLGVSQLQSQVVMPLLRSVDNAPAGGMVDGPLPAIRVAVSPFAQVSKNLLREPRFQFDAETFATNLGTNLNESLLRAHTATTMVKQHVDGIQGNDVARGMQDALAQVREEAARIAPVADDAAITA